MVPSLVQIEHSHFSDQLSVAVSLFGLLLVIMLNSLVRLNGF